MSDMSKFFHPKSIAIVGASQNPENLGHDVLENVLHGEAGRDRSNGYQDKVYPLSLKYDALEMLEEIKGKASYRGARGQPAADPDQLAELIVRVSEAVRLHPDIQELDANPLIVSKDGLVAVDARILIRE